MVAREAGVRPVVEAAEVAMAAEDGAAVIEADRAIAAEVEAGLTAAERTVAAWAASASMAAVATAASGDSPGSTDHESLAARLENSRLAWSGLGLGLGLRLGFGLRLGLWFELGSVVRARLGGIRHKVDERESILDSGRPRHVVGVRPHCSHLHVIRRDGHHALVALRRDLDECRAARRAAVAIATATRAASQVAIEALRVHALALILIRAPIEHLGKRREQVDVHERLVTGNTSRGDLRPAHKERHAVPPFPVARFGAAQAATRAVSVARAR
eukprot:scaffold50515_cov56-Phaeocystis_antarctica.AAC.1